MAGLRASGLGLTYGDGRGGTVALAGFDLEVADGEPVAIIGPSGCGKSTFLLAAAGLLAPSEGAMEVGGEAVSGPRRRTALILQDFGLLPWKTVRRNVELGLAIRHVAAAERADRGRAAVEAVGLTEFAEAYPAALSGGMRQRVAMARALALEADLLLMDEPLSALDALTREDLQDLLLDLWRRRGHTIVLVTHSIEEAVFLGRRVVVMSPRPGRVAAIVDNPGMGAPGYRQAPEFHQKAAALRTLLAAEGALHSAVGAVPEAATEGPS